MDKYKNLFIAPSSKQPGRWPEILRLLKSQCASFLSS